MAGLNSLSLLNKSKLYLGLIVLFLLGAVTSPYDSKGANIFIDLDNQLNVLRQISNNGILAVGMTLVILTAGIDLSVGSMMAFGTILTAMLLTMREASAASWMSLIGLAAAAFFVASLLAGAFGEKLKSGQRAGISAVVGVVGVALAAGAILWARGQIAGGFGILGVLICVPCVTACFGGLGGAVIAKGKLQPFVVTLAMMIVALGLARVTAGEGHYVYQIYYPGPVTPPGMPTATEAFKQLSGKAFGVFPIPTMFFIGALVVAHLLLSKTRFGRYVYAVGGNEEASRLSGIDVDRIKISVYAIAGFLAGLTGVLFTSQFSQGSTDAGKYMELDAIAATVIGGTSLMGGRGAVIGTFVGVLILGYLNNILQLNRIDPNVQLLLKGIIIIAAVLLQEGRFGDWLKAARLRISKGGTQA